MINKILKPLLSIIYLPIKGFFIIRYVTWLTFILIKGRRKKGHVNCGDSIIYYEMFGTGNTVILLHGGLVSMQAWYSQLPTLTKSNQVIAVDLRGHGRSTLGQHSLTYRLMAADIILVMNELQIDTAIIVGWSDGGNTGLLFALHYPARISKLVLISANFHPSGIQKRKRDELDTQTAASPNFYVRWMYQLQSPEPKNWSSLWENVTTMWKTRPQLSDSDLRNIAVPTLILVGEFDDIMPMHTMKMEKAVPNSELLVIPNVGHGLIYDRPIFVNNVIRNFISKPLENNKN